MSNAEWHVYIADTVRIAAATTSGKIRAISQLRSTFVAQYRGVTRGMDNAAFQALLFAQPYSRIAQVVDACRVSRPTATAWLNALERAGALKSVKVGRDKLFLNTALPDVLTAQGES